MIKHPDHHHRHHHEKRREHGISESESSDGGDITGDSEERNRANVSKRSRMWRTVSSSSSSDNDIEDKGNAERKGDTTVRRSSSSSHDKSRHHKNENKKKKKHHKHKKSKHHKRDKEKEREGTNSKNKGAVNQQEFGKYGILRESDFFKKQQEFEAWMVEQKKILDAGLLGKTEIKELFREYMEDFNTATLPHEKYINYERWELKEYEIKQRKLAKKRARGAISKSDEAQLADEQRRSKAQKEKDDYRQMIMSTMKSDKVKEMRQQELLRSEMQIAYKQGDVEKVKKLEARLKPDETDQV